VNSESIMDSDSDFTTIEGKSFTEDEGIVYELIGSLESKGGYRLKIADLNQQQNITTTSKKIYLIQNTDVRDGNI